MSKRPTKAETVPAAEGQTIYPEAFASVVAGRIKRKLGNHFNLSNFGVNLTTLAPGSASALMHFHSKQDEFVYVIDGTLTVRIGPDAYEMTRGDCVGFKSGTGQGHQIINRSDRPASYLEIGDRTAGDQAEFPEDDLVARQGDNGSWILSHKDGEPY